MNFEQLDKVTALTIKNLLYTDITDKSICVNSFEKYLISKTFHIK